MNDVAQYAQLLMRQWGTRFGAYLAMETALAKRILADRQAALTDPDEWPGASSTWDDLGQTSHELFWQYARNEAGLPADAPFKNDVLMRDADRTPDDGDMMLAIMPLAEYYRNEKDSVGITPRAALARAVLQLDACARAHRQALRDIQSQCAGHADEFSQRVWNIAERALNERR